MSRPEHWMRRAVELSMRAVQRSAGGPFGAVIVRADQCIGEGHNEVLASADPTAHAEIVAIRAACRALERFE